MRTKLELLKLLFEFTEENGYQEEWGIWNHHHHGICHSLINMFNKNIISKKERNLLYSIIKENKPEICYNNFYWWKPGLKEPRQEFLKSLIKKYE